MYNTSNIADLGQLLINRQLRNSTSILFLVKGVDNLVESTNILREYSTRCTEVFYNRVIDKPTYDETTMITSLVDDFSSPSIYQYSGVSDLINKLFSSLSLGDKNILTQSIFSVFSECFSNNISASLIKNGYIRCLVTLSQRLHKVVYNLDKPNSILYVGKPDKFDILTFTVLGLCGVDVVICDFTPTQTSECLCSNRFLLFVGSGVVNLSFLSYVGKGITNSNYKQVISNSWVNFQDYSSIEDLLKLVNFKVSDRYEQDKWKTVHLNILGVENVSTYSSILELFLLNSTATNRKLVLFDGFVNKPTYAENEEFKQNYDKQSLFEIFTSFKIFSDSAIILKLDEKIQDIISKNCFKSKNEEDSYIRILMLWFVRYLKLFFDTPSFDFSGTPSFDFFGTPSFDLVPLIISFGALGNKETDLLQLLSCLPIDMVSFIPNYKRVISDVDYKTVVCGSSLSIPSYPKNTGVVKLATVAYNAERELDTILYSDTSLFKVKQFKNINAVVLKTTYDEVGLLWNEPAKYRPSFESVGDLVTVPTIFTKINGVNPTYKSDILKLCTKNALLLHSFPIQLQPSVIDNSQTLFDFTRHLVFKDSIDFERLIKSSFYRYAVYSEETQSLIADKVDKLIHLNWCTSNDKNLVYYILDTLFRLPVNILQLIHNYDFTSDIPKIIIYNGANIPCTLQDCIILMFLKLIGFDILIFAPTGYRIIEQHISNQWFNEITIGEFDFSFADVSLIVDTVRNTTIPGKRKDNFFSRLFN